MADISKEDLKKEIQDILKDADLDNTSAKKVRLQLQEKLDCDLTERKKEVDALVMEVIDEQTQDDEGEEDEEDDGDEEEDEEEEEEKPRKKAASRKRADSDSEYDDEEPSDGGGSDYEPDEPVKVSKSSKKAVKRKNKFGSDDESSGEEWGGSKSKKKAASKKKKKKAGSDDDSEDEKPKRKRKPGAKNGFTIPLKLSAELADIVGAEEMPRHEVVKRMWQYIKDNNLQDPKNKQMVKVDDKLAKIVPTKKFRGFGMAKFLKAHMSAA